MQDAFIQIFRGIRSFRGDSHLDMDLPGGGQHGFDDATQTTLKEVSFDEPASLDYSPVPREFGRTITS